MINYGKNKNVLAGNFQKTIRFAARLLERLEYSGMPIKRAGSIKRAGTISEIYRWPNVSAYTEHFQ